jgi:formylglycine-generating enzyme required for sulfatase activity
MTVVAVAASGLVLGQGAAAPGRRVAFLVGVNEYQNNGFKNLSWAEHDVTEMAKELERLGFDKVVTLKGASASKGKIETQLTLLLDDVHKNDLVLVMLSGHGQQLPVKDAAGVETEDAFFCPANAVVGEPDTLVSLSWLTDKKLSKHASKNLVLVDACRDSVIVDPDKGVNSKGIEGKRVALPEGIAILFSCSSGQKSVERDNLKHGVFAFSALEVLKAFDGSGRALTWNSLVDGVLEGVSDLNAEQQPVLAGVMPRLVLAPGSAPTAMRLEGRAPGELRDDNAIKMKFRWCPPGTFRMGSPADEPVRDKDVEGQVEVTLRRGFWMGQYELTQSQWRTVMGTTLEQQRDKAGSNSLCGDGPDHPIYYVNHTEATEFCRRFTESERNAGRLPAGWEYRLPTEAQWEYACRAGTTTPTAFGASLGSTDANFNGNYPYNGAVEGPYLEKTTAVGRYRKNEWNLYDMHGNVRELCADGYAEQLAGGVDPSGPSTAALRVRRGGGWKDGGGYCRSAKRFGYDPSSRLDYLGFRVARVPSGA